MLRLSTEIFSHFRVQPESHWLHLHPIDDIVIVMVVQFWVSWRIGHVEQNMFVLFPLKNATYTVPDFIKELRAMSDVHSALSLIA